MQLHCFIGAINSDEHRECRARLAAALPESADLRIWDVLCTPHSEGWRGCWDCHTRLSTAALEVSSDVYITLEAKARPTLRFDYARLLEAVSALRSNPDWEAVNLSILPWPFKGHPRRHVARDVYENSAPVMNGTTAMLCTRSFAQRLLALKHDEPIDLQLANAGIARYAVYPAPFQRNAEPSSTTAPLLGRRWLSSPLGYMVTEFISQFPMEVLLFFLCALGVFTTSLKSRRPV